MTKIAKAPSGFYTASDVMKKLGLQSSTFYEYVKTGRIKKVVPPGRKEGYYPKAEVDKFIRAKEAFILQYATDPTLFDKAQEEDIEAITYLGIELFGKHGSPNYETRLAQYHANPDIFYVLRQEEIIVGYIGFFPLKHEAMEAIMAGMEEDRFRASILTPANIVPFKSGEAKELFIIIGAKQDVKKSIIYGSRLISGAIKVLEHLARKSIITESLYATSRTRDGIKLCKNLGFKQIFPEEEEDNLLRFKLDLLTTSNPLLKRYERIVNRVTSNQE
jgi:predicted DNA-binding transcriptional regulator AlpA